MLTAAEFLQLWKDCDNGEFNDDDGVETVETGEWTQDHKYQYLDTVYKKGDQYFSISESRSGSYHTDWYYNDPDCFEVEPYTITKTITTYRLKK